MKTKKTTKPRAKKPRVFTDSMLDLTPRSAVPTDQDSPYRTLLRERLEKAWKVAGLGARGALACPASWATGPERNRQRGLGYLVGYECSVSNSETEAPHALLEGKNQSANFKRFLESNGTDLALLGLLYDLS